LASYAAVLVVDFPVDLQSSLMELGLTADELGIS